MLRRVTAFIARHGMLQTSARVGVAVSGGADSVCLLHVLRTLRADWDLRLTVLHVNHRLRGAESDADEQFVRDLACQWGFPIDVQHADVSEEHGNLEQAARDARHGFFRRLIGQGSVDRVALGHTKSDQAETVLFRFLRGAFTAGLAGMRSVTPNGLIRPLLEVDRAEVESFLKQQGITWRDDSSNRDRRFARNRIRHNLLPALAAEWNPQLTDLLAGYACLAQADEEYWDTHIRSLEPDVLRTAPDGATLADVTDLMRLPEAVVRRVLRRAIERVRGDLRQIDSAHITSALAMLRTDAGHARCQVPGVDILRSCDQIRFARSVGSGAGLHPPRDYEFPIAVPGAIETVPDATPIRLELVDNSELSLPHDKLVASLDWARVQSVSGSIPLRVRNWRPGDSYQRIGGNHEHKVKHLFQEYRIPLWERRSWPVLVNGDQILWVKRFGPAQEFAADPSSRVVLVIHEQTGRDRESPGSNFTSL